jgi:hypothetical protein
MQPMNHHIEIIDYETPNGGESSVAERLKLAPNWTGREPIFGFRAGYAVEPAPASGRRSLSVVVVT